MNASFRISSLLLFNVLFLTSVNCFSQSNPDKLITKNGTEYLVRILDETNDMVTFYVLDDSTKAEKKLLKSSFNKIEYFKIPRKVNLININHPTLKNDELFKSVGVSLRDEGFMFQEVDKDFWMITTKAKEGKYSITYWFNVSVSGDKIMLRAYGDNEMTINYGAGISSDLSGKSGTRGSNSGMKNSLVNYPFEMMNKFANRYTFKNGGIIEYIEEE